ncbi:MAG: TSUP family transporter, partial [Candidatus Thermoplasmatota archaeon]|nr:TSUP family transporter [Candidatus Thermoplasmatota archaeon]
MDALIVVLIAVLLTAFLFAPLGLGGGMLFVPILHYLADWPLDTATLVVSLLLTLSVSFGSGAVHHREGLIDLATVRGLAPFAMIGAAGGAV